MSDSKALWASLPTSQTKAVRPQAHVWLGYLILILLAAIPLALHDPFYLHLAIMICLNAIIVSGLSVLARTGQISLCHGAFVGIGAYMSVLIVMGLHLPFLLGLVVAMLSSALIAALLGAIMLRLTGVYFVLVTFAFGELFRLILLQWDSLTGGANGIPGIPPASILGVSFGTKPAFYGLALVLTVLVTLALRTLYRSPAGHAIDTVGENARLAEASGVSVRHTQLFAFVVGSALAGLGGALMAHYLGFISPESFNTNLSITLIIFMVVGGRKALLGPVIGALIMTPLPEFFRSAVESQNIFYGIALILMLRFLPQGLAGLASRRRAAKERA